MVWLRLAAGAVERFLGRVGASVSGREREAGWHITPGEGSG